MTEVKNLEIQLLAPPEGNSAILEVCDEVGQDFLHVTAISNDEYSFKFFIGNGELILTLSQIDEIVKATKDNIKYITYEDEGS